LQNLFKTTYRHSIQRRSKLQTAKNQNDLLPHIKPTTHKTNYTQIAANPINTPLHNCHKPKRYRIKQSTVKQFNNATAMLILSILLSIDVWNFSKTICRHTAINIQSTSLKQASSSNTSQRQKNTNHYKPENSITSLHPCKGGRER
jgi:hypothetical protein